MSSQNPARSSRSKKLAIAGHARQSHSSPFSQLKNKNNNECLASAQQRDEIQFPPSRRMALAPEGPMQTTCSNVGTALPHRKTGSTSLTFEQVVNLRAAAVYADTIGLPFNRMTTINWEQGGVSDVVGATGRFIKLMRDWLRVNGGRFACMWVQERGPVTGAHVHLLMHVPPTLTRKTSHRHRGWLKACGLTYRKGMMKTSRIGASYKACLASGPSREAYLGNLATVVDYVLKDASPCVRQRLGIKAKGNCGHVYGKRCGTSQNIGKLAQSRCSATDTVATDPSPILSSSTSQSFQPL